MCNVFMSHIINKIVLMLFKTAMCFLKNENNSNYNVYTWVITLEKYSIYMDTVILYSNTLS